MDSYNDQSSDKIKTGKPITGPMITGVLLILLGGMLFIAQLFGKNFISSFWPFLFIGGGLIFYAVYFLKKSGSDGAEGLLFPGTYLSLLGVLFFFLELAGWNLMKYLWPTFVFGVAIALGVMYRFTSEEHETRRKDLLASVKALSVISMALYLIAFGGLRFWPIGLIVIGAIIIYKAMKAREREQTEF